MTSVAPSILPSHFPDNGVLSGNCVLESGVADGFCPHPDQWELDLGDMLPLAVGPCGVGRSERSERGRRRLVCHSQGQ
jgi:hypothetical protein